MRQLASKLRVFSVAVAVVMPLAGVRGLCFMSSELPGTAGSEHECCKTGRKLVPPNCCVAVTWEQAPARTASRMSVDMAAPVAFTLTRIDPTTTGRPPAARPERHEHDPPERIVLRI